MIVASVTYVSSFCDDKENNFLRYNIQRIGVRRYVTSKITVVFCTAFVVVVIGSFLFVFFQNFELPLTAPDSIAVENFKSESCFGWLLPKYTELYIGIQIFLHGLYCASMSVLSLAISTFVQNSYAVYAIPFLLDYFFIFLFSRAAAEYPMLYMEEIYNSAISTYTDIPTLLLFYAIWVTVLFLMASWIIMFKKIEGEYT